MDMYGGHTPLNGMNNNKKMIFSMVSPLIGCNEKPISTKVKA
jgi:hypothetical protein